MRDLDNPENLEAFDGSDMLKLLLGFPQQYQHAHRLAEKLVLPEAFGQAKNIVISGMGGSAIGGDLLRSLFSGSCPVPIIVNRNYSIPRFVNEDTLFIAASYSGNTEETLAAFEAALGKKANMAKRVLDILEQVVENLRIAARMPVSHDSQFHCTEYNPDALLVIFLYPWCYPCQSSAS